MAKYAMRWLVVLIVGVLTTIVGTVALAYVALPLVQGETPSWFAAVFTPGSYDEFVLSLGAIVGALIGYLVYPLHRLLLRVGMRLGARAVPAVLPWPAMEAFAGHVPPPAKPEPTPIAERPVRAAAKP